jgi:acyl-CoA thioesterase
MPDLPDPVETVRRHFQNDPFARANGIELVDLGVGHAKTRVVLEERHWNCFGITHGGMLFTLAAIAFAAACNTGGRVAVGVNMNLVCLKTSRTGTLVAEATEVSRSSRLSTATVQVTNAAGDLVAIFQGTAFLKDA